MKGEDLTEEIKAIDKELLYMSKPLVIGGKNGLEVKQIKGIIDTNTLINQQGNFDIKSMSEVEYFQTLDLIEDQFKAKKKALNRSKRR